MHSASTLDKGVTVRTHSWNKQFSPLFESSSDFPEHTGVSVSRFMGPCLPLGLDRRCPISKVLQRHLCLFKFNGTVIMTRNEFVCRILTLYAAVQTTLIPKAMRGTVGALFPQRDRAAVPIRSRLIV